MLPPMKMSSLASLAGAFWALSLFLSLGTIPPLEIERLYCVVIGLAALAPLVLCGTPLPERAVIAPRIGLAILLLWVLIAVSSAWSVAPPVTLIYLGVFSLLPATILAILVADPVLQKPFIKAAGIGSGVVITGLALWALIQIFFFPEMLVNGQVRNPFANPNAFAGLLGLSTMIGLGLYLQSHNRIHTNIFLAGLFFILCAFIALSSRAASMTLGTTIIIMVILCGRDVIGSRWKSLSCLALAVGAVIYTISHLPARATLAGQLYRMVEDRAATLQNRFDIWQGTLHLIADNPWLGSGYRTFFLTYPSVRLPGDTFSSGAMAHSDPLQLWAEIGILGPVLFYAIGIMVLLRFIRFWRDRNSEKTEHTTLSLALFLGCAGFIVHTHADFLLYAMPLTMVFALALATLLTQTDSGDSKNSFVFMRPWPRYAAGIAVIAPVIAMIALFTPLMLGQYYTNQAKLALHQNDLNGYGAAINRANDISMGMNDRPYLMAATVPMGLLQAQHKNLTRGEQEKLFHQIDSLLSRALTRNARMAEGWQQRGEMLRLIDPAIPPAGYPSTQECFETALRINPLYLSARLSLADLYMDQNQTEKAFEVLMDGIHWPYTYDEAMAYYERTEKMARALHRDDALPDIEKHKARQAGRLKRAADHRDGLTGAGLSTAN